MAFFANLNAQKVDDTLYLMQGQSHGVEIDENMLQKLDKILSQIRRQYPEVKDISPIREFENNKLIVTISSLSNGHRTIFPKELENLNNKYLGKIISNLPGQKGDDLIIQFPENFDTLKLLEIYKDLKRTTKNDALPVLGVRLINIPVEEPAQSDIKLEIKPNEWHEWKIHFTFPSKDDNSTLSDYLFFYDPDSENLRLFAMPEQLPKEKSRSRKNSISKVTSGLRRRAVSKLVEKLAN